ncbi:unnamed protein product [Phaedon cochleariae]|uniref:Pre-rRNA-processing protein RIX1 N-terminal domain-containing protein n=1 Tax=Phaedon cochleariae TaxID=80249 RepID=A0A9N9SJ64_PHACE|nr:unnamed protein product [Phaedon cochleariae]
MRNFDIRYPKGGKRVPLVNRERSEILAASSGSPLHVGKMPLTSSQIEEGIIIDSYLKSTFSSILNLHLQNETSEKAVISAINKLLSVSKTRPQGLEYLNLILNNCSIEIVSQNALNWINHCLVKYTDDQLKEVKLLSIGNIVENVYKDQDFSKKFVSDYLNKVMEMCLSSHNNPNEIEAALGTLTICMKHYASWFTSHKIRIETFLLQYLESSVDSIVEKAAIGFHFSQQIGGGGIDGSNHINSFSSSFRKLCATVHKLFDKFLENETEFDEFKISDLNGFDFNESAHDSQKMQQVVARHIHNCLKFIMTMMIKGFPVAKEIRPLEVLNIIRRGTSIHHCVSTDKVNSIADFQFSLLLNNIQIQLLQLLRVTIIWMQANSLPFSFIISKVLVDCLKKVESCDCFLTNWLYKETVYKVLHQWIQISKCSLHPHFQNQLISCILIGITPVKSQLSLKIISATDKNKSKKAQHKAVTERIIAGRLENGSLHKTEAEKIGDEKICSMALDTLKHLLTSSNLKIKSELLKDVYSSVLGTLNEINTSNLSHPYTNPECQAKLYQVLVSFYEQDTLDILPPLQLTLDILNKGANSYNRHISSVCEKGLSVLEKLCQPVCPSLYSPDMFPARQGDDQKEKVFSEEVVEMVTQSAEVEQEESLNVLNGGIVRPETSMEVCETEEQETSLNKSVNILDVCVVRPPTEKEDEVAEGSEVLQAVVDGPDEIDESKTEEHRVPSQELTLNTEINILKDEVLNYSTIELDNTIAHHEVKLNEVNIELEESDDENVLTIEETEKEDENYGEPPLKKCKGEETKSEEITIEEQSAEQVDTGISEDIEKGEELQEDSFVDEVKDY